MLDRPVHPKGITIFTMVMSAFFVFITLSLMFYMFSLYTTVWSSAYEDIQEKHGLLAHSISKHLTSYLDKHRAAISLLSLQVSHLQNKQQIQHSLLHFLDTHPNFKAITILKVADNGKLTVVDGAYIDDSDRVVRRPRVENYSLPEVENLFDLNPAQRVSGIRKVPFSADPVLLIRGTTRVHGNWLALGELKTQPIVDFCDEIKLGKHGYCAVIDHRGRVVTHPDATWVKERKDVSNWDIFKKARQSTFGVTEFFSPVFNEMMISGYSSVDEFDWVVILPQPKSEVKAYSLQVVYQQLPWAFIVIGISIFYAIFFSKWISAPINRLAQHATQLRTKKELAPLPAISNHSPRELHQLYTTLNELISWLLESKVQITTVVEHSPIVLFNCSMDGQINFATGQRINLLGVTSDDIVGKNIQTIMGTQVSLKDILETLTEKREWTGTITINNSVFEIWATYIEENQNIIFICTDISDGLLAAESEDFLKENRGLLQRCLNAEEIERRRITFELHDLLGQDLTATRNYSVLIQALVNGELKKLPDHTSRRERDDGITNAAQSITKITTELQTIVRSMLKRLWPESLEELGLPIAIQEMVDDYCKQLPLINFNYWHTSTPFKRNRDRDIYLYRIAQEALTNIVRHAEASKVDIELNIEILQGSEKYITLSISDNGIGFDTKVNAMGYGLLGMRERTIAVNGTFELVSKKGKGTTITVSIPLNLSSKYSRLN